MKIVAPERIVPVLATVVIPGELAFECLHPSAQFGPRGCVHDQMHLVAGDADRGDFRDGYDFFEAFRKPFLPSSALTATAKSLK
jgi:hypothetical protein